MSIEGAIASERPRSYAAAARSDGLLAI